MADKNIILLPDSHKRRLAAELLSQGYMQSNDGFTQKERIMPMTLDVGDTKAVVRMESELGISSAAESKTLLLDALALGKGLVVHLDDCTGLDVTIMQLVFAARQHAARLGLSFECAGTVPQPVRAALDDAGLMPFLKDLSL